MQQKRFLALFLSCTLLLATGCHAKEAFSWPPSKDLDDYDSKEAAYEAVWGDMEDYYGEYIEGELDFDQQSMVHYPAIDRSKVFWIESGVHFHSIEWCYGLEADIADTGDDEILHGSSSKSVIAGMTACSKCVGTDPLPRLRKAFFGNAKTKDEKNAEQEQSEE